MFGLPVRVAQIFFMRPVDMCKNSYICLYNQSHMTRLDRYTKYCWTLFVVMFCSFGCVWAAEDSTYTNLMKECINSHIVNFEGFDDSQGLRSSYKHKALDLDYSELEAQKLMNRFFEEFYYDFFLGYVEQYFVEEVSVEDMRTALSLFESDQGVRAKEDLDYLESEEFRKKFEDRLCVDIAEIIVEGKVTKKKCDLPKEYQKLFRSFIRSSIHDESALASESLYFMGDRANGGFEKLFLEYMSSNVIVVLMQLAYPKVTLEDLRFMHDFNSSKLGGKFCRIGQKAFSNIDDYYLTLGERVDIFLEEEYGKHPPKVMEATPEDEPVEDNNPV